MNQQAVGYYSQKMALFTSWLFAFIAVKIISQKIMTFKTIADLICFISFSLVYCKGITINYDEDELP
jgi:hypothetical protein